jgi:hypothetical protein
VQGPFLWVAQPFDASQGNTFAVVTGAIVTIQNPTNPTAGQRLTIQIQGFNGNNWAITWGTAYRATGSLSLPANTGTAGNWKYAEFMYNNFDSKWDLINVVQ